MTSNSHFYKILFLFLNRFFVSMICFEKKNWLCLETEISSIITMEPHRILGRLTMKLQRRLLGHLHLLRSFARTTQLTYSLPPRCLFLCSLAQSLAPELHRFRAFAFASVSRPNSPVHDTKSGHVGNCFHEIHYCFHYIFILLLFAEAFRNRIDIGSSIKICPIKLKTKCKKKWRWSCRLMKT